MATERRWAIISQDGRHTWLGRNSEPTADEIAKAEASLPAQGVPAWLTVVNGDYWSSEALEFLVVRAIAEARDAHWPLAKMAFLAARDDLPLERIRPQPVPPPDTQTCVHFPHHGHF